MIWRLLQWIGLISILTACQAKVEQSQAILSSTLPPGVKADALYVDEDTERRGSELMASQPGGMLLGIRGTFEEMVPNSYSSFYVRQDQPFIGEFDLRSAKQETHSYVFICLLDYLQIPCSPEAEPFQFVKDVSTGDLVQIPIRIPVKDKRLYDFAVVYQEDPYLAGPIGSGSFQNRTLRDLYEMRANISVDGEIETLAPQYVEPPGGPGQGAVSYGFAASDLENPTGSQGGWAIWTETTAKAGEFLDFFLHFDSDKDRKYALVAFIDFEQTPIYVNDKPHLPLYVQVRASIWHPMPVQIRVPEQPGRYELRLLSIREPFARLDLPQDGDAPLTMMFPQSSPRILLKVE